MSPGWRRIFGVELALVALFLFSACVDQSGTSQDGGGVIRFRMPPCQPRSRPIKKLNGRFIAFARPRF